MYMDDINFFAKNEKALETGIQTLRLFIQIIGMEFNIEKCAMLLMKNVKRHIPEGVKLPNQVIRMLEEKETYRYLGILKADIINQVEMKWKNYKE